MMRQILVVSAFLAAFVPSGVPDSHLARDAGRGVDSPALATWMARPIAGQLPRIAVLDFTNGTVVGAKEADVLRTVLGMTLAGALRKSGQFDVVERQQLATILGEQDLGASGRVDEATAAKMGKVLGAQYMLLGTYMVQPDREMQVTTRLVNVTTGTVAFAPEVVGDSRAVTGVMSKLAVEVVRGLDITPDPSWSTRDNTRLRPEMVRLIDALAKACDKRDSSSVTSVRRDIEAAAPGHPALSAPCL